MANIRKNPSPTIPFGGWSGALMAQKLLRHKTIKQPFRIIFWLSLFANLGIVGWLLFAENSQFLHEMIKSYIQGYNF